MPKAKKPSPENEPLLERGQKQRTGRMLSEYIRAIGQDMTEVVLDDVPEGVPVGVPKLVSKAEALARWLWSRALPHKGDDGDMVQPDLDIVKIVLDRVDGKPSVQGAEDTDAGKESVPEKISRLNAERVNRIASETMGDE